MDLFEKLNTLKSSLGQFSDDGHGYYTFPKLKGEVAAHMEFNGKRVLTWSLNNYLGLANHPEVRKIDAEAAAKWGLAYPMGSRMMSGNTDLHDLLEAQLSDFVHKEDTVLLNYGYQGIFSIIDSLLDRHDVVVYDEQSHACIVDGLRLHIGKRFVFKHNDIESLEKQLQRAVKVSGETGGAILVITEGVFGMSGIVGNLKDIVALKEKYSFRLMVDDAHGFGTMGTTGAGTGEFLGIQDGIDLYFSTFAKSMASIGAFVSSTKEICMYLRYTMRSQIFAKSLPMPIVEGALKRLELLKTRPELRENLWTIVRALQNGLKERGFNIGYTQSPVTPVFLSGGLGETSQLVVDLRENFNIFCSAVVYPVVPKGVIMLRLIPTAMHSLEDVETTLKAFEAVSKKLASGMYSNEIHTVQV
ncbi:MAG: aminotransferase class I/II-fold pyridoxal phosphate-dependent enzyme [Microscillaceae bacterium]|nr:aminotransferase class I/II-fold pyridoxal phosphate-dependent enzyme [Microscillaceae bacterium]